MKFIHAADIHLDSPLVGLERYEGAPVDELRGAARKAFENLIRLAIDEAVDFVLLAGDIYDGNWRDYNVGLYFIKQMEELGRQGIKVFMVSGNHDAANRISRELKLPANVHRFSDKNPETIKDEDLGIAVHGQSYRTAELQDNLAVSYPENVPGLFNIGLLHSGVTGRPGHANYAPCSLDNLTAKNYDYWALGHIHMREELSREPWVVMPGNIQGRHIRETGIKGCSLVMVANGVVQEVAHHPLDVVRWARIEVDASDAETAEDALDLAVAKCNEAATGCDNLLLAVRIEFVGSSRAHAQFITDGEHWENELRALLLSHFGDQLWAEKILFKTTHSINLDDFADNNDPFAILLHAVGNVNDIEELLVSERAAIDAVLNKIPVDLRDQLELPDLDNPDEMQILFGEIREMLLPLLMADRGAE
ncbi:MAG: DNA repair exonuclease [Desulfobulbaceae bacterium]|nr:DNA repair exonuclease [Desulfobulbaceae bacterium]